MTLPRIVVTILVLQCIWVSGESGARRKRIVRGSRYSSASDFYAGSKWNVWIGDSFGQPTRKHWYSFSAEVYTASLKNFKCGGVLLTPDIVQTSCTCISRFVGRTKGEEIVRAVPDNVFENPYLVFFSEKTVDQMEWLILARTYVVYDECANVYLPTIRDPDGPLMSFVKFNMGLIVLQKKFTEWPVDADVTYAPQQTYDDIIKYYYEAVEREYMCLFFGWGPVKETITGRNPGGDENSVLQLYGWRPLMNERDCYYATFGDSVDHESNKLEINGLFNYSRDATWVCANSVRPKTYPEKHSATLHDDGGPVACNNEYFGVISGSEWIRLAHLSPKNERPRVKLTIITPIVYTLWENSLDYRSEFIKQLHDMIDEKHNFSKTVGEEINFRPTRKLFYMSPSPQISASIYFILFFSSLSKLL